MNDALQPDLGPLIWVKGEIDRAAAQAAEEFAHYVDAPDETSHLRCAQTHIHQAVGALGMVGLEGLARFSESIEALLAELHKGNVSISLTTLDLVQNAIAALRRYLEELAAGAPDQPLKLWPLYEKLLAERGLSGVSPGELFYPDLGLAPRALAAGTSLSREERFSRLRTARSRFEHGLLAWLRGAAQGRGLAEMGEALATPEALADTATARAFWSASLGVVDALAAGGLPPSLALKRLWGRVGTQLRRVSMGSPVVAERLVRDVLYYVAITEPVTDRLRALHSAFHLDALIPASPAGGAAAPLRAALRGLREPVHAAKDAWNRFCAGVAVGLPQFAEACRLIAERSHGLEIAELERLCAATLEIAQWLRKDPLQHNEAVAMEVATALLLIETAAEEDAEPDPQLSRQAALMSERLGCVERGQALARLDQPLLGEMSRRAQERLLMGQVAREILNSLAIIEQTLDGYFRDPGRAPELGALARPFREIEGALAMLGQDPAIALLRECEARIAAFESGAGEPADTSRFDDVAYKLSALGFFVDRLQHGAADLDEFLHPERRKPAAAAPEPAGSVEHELERSKDETHALIEALRARPDDERLRAELKSNLETMRESASLVGDVGLESRAGQVLAELAAAPSAEAAARVSEAAQEIAPVVEKAAPAPATQEAIDAELLAIFIEEAREVLAAIAAGLERSRAEPHDQEVLSTIRRGFHTLKGSGRMVGLRGLGDAAWSVEQVMNRWLQLEQDASDALHALIADARGLLAAWVEQLAAGGGAERDAGELLRAAEALKSETDAASPAPASEVPEAIEIESLDEEELGEEEAAPGTAPAWAEEQVRIGAAVLSRKIYEMYLGEARGHAGTLRRELARLHLNPSVLPAGQTIRAAHTLAGVSATVGLGVVHDLARALEHAMARLAEAAAPAGAGVSEVLNEAAAAIEAMVAAVAEEREPDAAAALIERLGAAVPAALEAFGELREEAEMEVEEAAGEEPAAPAVASAAADEPVAVPEVFVAAAPEAPPAAESAAESDRRKLRLADDVDPLLLPVFLEEADDLMREINAQLRAWSEPGAGSAPRDSLKRLLHTFKGSARMAGAMGLGEVVHAIEARFASAREAPAAEFIDELYASLDRCAALIERLRAGPEPAAVPESEAVPEAQPVAAMAETEGAQLLRVRAELVDRFVNDAGEISISRLRIEAEMRQLRSSLRDLTDNVIRLRGQLRELEIQTESTTQAQLHDTEARGEEFDPLELDRYTRAQELTRMIAESVNDVATVQQSLLRHLDAAESTLNVQGRLNRDMQQGLMSVRMVPFASLADRLHRIVRQTAKELGKPASLAIRGGQVELDRGVLDRMVGSFEHLLRNAVSHGIEDTARRRSGAKPAIGEIELTVGQAGSELAIELADDGGGLDYERIRARAIEAGLLPAGAPAGRDALAQLIFRPGFSTATEVSAISGRGVGMDVVRDAVQSLGGRIEVSSEPGAGTRFRIHLPMTLAVMQSLLVRAAERTYAIPSAMIEQVMEIKAGALASVREQGSVEWLDNRYPYHYLPCLLGDPAAPVPERTYHCLLLARAGTQRIAVEVDSLRGNQEIVVKKTAPQLARILGITGATVLGDGEIALILNPVALVGRAADVPLDADAQRRPAASADMRPSVMVVDDSLTVRKITGRLLEREGYRVLTARDGVDALDQMATEVPDVILADIEMPRMDGFALARNMRASHRLRRVPIIFVTSRTADKHRELAREIGVEYFLGKPYQEEKLLELVACQTRAASAAA